LYGLVPDEFNSSILGGVALYNGQIVLADGYDFGAGSENSPRYLTPQGEIVTTSDSSYLKLVPWTNRRTEHLVRNKAARAGQVIWHLTAGLSSGFFDVTGLGKYEFDGWAKANGQNGTTDLSNAIAGLTAIQKI
jgi:hypothetical protein